MLNGRNGFQNGFLNGNYDLGDIERKINELKKEREKFGPDFLEYIKQVKDEFDKKIGPLIKRGSIVLSFADWDTIARSLSRQIVEYSEKNDIKRVYEDITDLVFFAPYILERKQIYVLAPAVKVIEDLINKCKTNEKEMSEKGVDCNVVKDSFAAFVEKYEQLKKNTPFYIRWYYWFKNLSFWKKVLIVAVLLIILYVVLLIIFKRSPKVRNLLKRIIAGDKNTLAAVHKTVKNTDTKTKGLAVNLSLRSIKGKIKKRQLYLYLQFLAD